MFALHDYRRKVVQHLHVAEIARPLRKHRSRRIRVNIEGAPELPAFIPVKST